MGAAKLLLGAELGRKNTCPLVGRGDRICSCNPLESLEARDRSGRGARTSLLMGMGQNGTPELALRSWAFFFSLSK